MLDIILQELKNQQGKARGQIKMEACTDEEQYDKKEIQQSTVFDVENIYFNRQDMQDTQRIFITGGNRGLGKELVKLLHQNHPNLEVHISSRGSPEELSNQWKTTIPNHQFKCHKMELNDHQSIQKIAKDLKKDNVTFNYLVANAAIFYQKDATGARISAQESALTLKTNVDSTIDFIKGFLPLLAEDGRVIIVSSFYGSLNFQTVQFKKLLTDLTLTQEQILGLSKSYSEAVAKNQMGFFCDSAYQTSKALLNAWARFVIPKYLKQKQTCVTMHPGWCSTDMGGPNATMTPLQGATRIYDCLWLKQVQSDKFYNCKFCSFESCQ